MAVSLHLAGEKGSGCIGMQLYLPEEWARGRKRRTAAGLPKQVRFQRKWEIALAQLDEALLSANEPVRWKLMRKFCGARPERALPPLFVMDKPNGIKLPTRDDR